MEPNSSFRLLDGIELKDHEHEHEEENEKENEIEVDNENDEEDDEDNEEDNEEDEEDLQNGNHHNSDNLQLVNGQDKNKTKKKKKSQKKKKTQDERKEVNQVRRLSSNGQMKKGRFDWFTRTRYEYPEDSLFGLLPVISSFLCHCVVLGIIYTFGVYFREYLRVFPDVSPSLLSLIGTLTPGFFPAVGILTGPLADRFGSKLIVSIGILMYVVALVLASFSTEYWHLILTQGVMLGVASSFCYHPSVASVPPWFSKYRGIATGSAVAGSGVGGLILGPLTQKLIDTYGWRWSLRVNALISLSVLIVSWCLLFQRIPPKRGGPLFNFGMFKEKSFSILFVGSFCATFGFLVPFYYLSVFAEKKAGLTTQDGAILIGIVNGSSGAGRFILGFTADKLGRMNLYCICMFIGSVSAYLWPFCTSFPTLATFCIFFGFFGGGFVSLTPVVLAEYWGVEKLGGVLGLFLSSTFPGNLLGVSIAGAIYLVSDGDFHYVSLYTGSMMMITFICDLIVKFMNEPIKKCGKCFS